MPESSGLNSGSSVAAGADTNGRGKSCRLALDYLHTLAPEIDAVRPAGVVELFVRESFSQALLGGIVAVADAIAQGTESQWTGSITERKKAEEVRRLNEGLEKCVRERTARLEAVLEKIKESDERLREGEDRFDLVLQGANDGVFDWDLRSGQFCLDNRLYEVAGLSRQSLTQDTRDLPQFTHPEDRQRVGKSLTAFFKPDILTEFIELFKENTASKIAAPRRAVKALGLHSAELAAHAL